MSQTSTKDAFIANVARRLYMHALKGGRIKASDMARVVEVMEMMNDAIKGYENDTGI